MPSEKSKITTYVPLDIYDKFMLAAREEKRSKSSLLYKIVVDYLESRDSNRATTTPQPPPQEDSKFLDGHDFLKIMASGRRPTDAEITEVAHSEDVDPDVLIEIRDRKFPTTSHYKQPNGNPSAS